MTRKHFIIALFVILLVFFGWRFVRPLNIFVVTDNFDKPVDTTTLPATISGLRASDCGVCHKVFQQE